MSIAKNQGRLHNKPEAKIVGLGKQGIDNRVLINRQLQVDSVIQRRFPTRDAGNCQSRHLYVYSRFGTKPPSLNMSLNVFCLCGTPT